MLKKLSASFLSEYWKQEWRKKMTVTKQYDVYFVRIGAVAFVNADRLKAMKMASAYAFGAL